MRMLAPAMIQGRTLPVQEMIWPEMVEESSTPTIIGMVISPASVGEKPRPTW